jgi:RNA polymerase sigma-70 factor (ECF subfamily)
MSTASISGEEIEALRAPLTRYCYRLLGSAADTDDAVQETLVRAAARIDQFDPNRARLTTWLHRIATNICIDMLRASSRRAIAMDLGPAAQGAGDLGVPLQAHHWVEPMAGSRLFHARDPADLVLEGETVKLAFVALLQWLPPRQRAVLVLRDVLAFSAQETAEILGATVGAVNSALQRARATLNARPRRPTDLLHPEDPDQQELLARYVHAFETHDSSALTALLREDATSSMPPFAWWLQGPTAIASVLAASDACAGDRLLPTDINASPGFGQYRPGQDAVLRPFALLLVETSGHQIADIVTFLGTSDRFSEFGLPIDFPSPTTDEIAACSS